MARSAWMVAGSCALLVQACASGLPKNVEEAADLPPPPRAWAAISSEKAMAPATLTRNWLADLNDPEITELVDYAISHNKNLAASAARVESARASARVTRSGLLPSITAGLSGSTTDLPGGTVSPISTENYGLDFTVTWEIDVWGRLSDQTRAAYLDAASFELDFASAKLSIAGAVAQSYYAVAAARLQRQLSERDVETGEANLRIIERRYKNGVSNSLDVRLARSSLASSRALLLQRQQAEQESARQLEVLLGNYPDADQELLTSLPDLAELVDEDGRLPGYGTPLDVISRRPDILSAEASLRASGLRVSAARKALLPSLSLRGTAGQDSDEFGDLSFDLDEMTSTLIGNLVHPLFAGGRLRATAAARKADMEAILFNYAQTVLTAYQDVENAIAAEDILADRYTAQEIAFDEAVAAERLTARQYLNGTTSIFNLISAQQRRISAESQFISAGQARLSNRIDLYLALGAPFTTPSEVRLSDERRSSLYRFAVEKLDQGDRS